MKLVAVELDCKSMLFRVPKEVLCLGDLPRLFFNKDIEGCGQLASGHFGNELFAYFRDVTGPV